MLTQDDRYLRQIAHDVRFVSRGRVPVRALLFIPILFAVPVIIFSVLGLLLKSFGL